MQQPGSTSDDEWFDGFYADHYADVYAFAYRRLLDHAMAEDLTAEVFATVWVGRGKLPSDDVVPWMYGVAHNKLKATYRTEARRQRLHEKISSQPLSLVEDPGATVPATLDHKAAAEAIFEALDERDAEVLRLWAWEGLEPRHIATVLGISAVAARARLSRAKKRAAKHAGNQGATIYTIYSA